MINNLADEILEVCVEKNKTEKGVGMVETQRKDCYYSGDHCFHEFMSDRPVGHGRYYPQNPLANSSAGFPANKCCHCGELAALSGEK